MTKVMKIGDYTCGGCSKLREVLLPIRLKALGSGCFHGGALERLDVPLILLETLDVTIFLGCHEVWLLGSESAFDRGSAVGAWHPPPVRFTLRSPRLAIVILPVAAYSACRLPRPRMKVDTIIGSGLVGWMSLPTRPLWPPK